MTIKTQAKPKAPANATAAKSPPLVVTLLAPTQIPLDKLALSKANVRNVKAGISIDALAQSIARRGLLQSLSVREQLGDDGKPNGFYDVQAGGRRLRALQLLAKQKSIPKDAAIACIIRQGGIAEDDSLAENTHREALHPLDQFHAFTLMKERGMSLADIAAAYGVTPAVVKQRLRLDSASEKLRKAYAEDEIDLDQLMAFCVTDDHKRQNEVFKLIQKGHHGGAHAIRKLLTEHTIPANDRRVLFVGLKAYKQAGGSVMNDLFQSDHGGFLQDPDILTRLLNEKLSSIQKAIIDVEGWKWTELSLDGYSWTIKQGLHTLPEEARLSAADAKARAKLSDEYDALIEELDEDSDTAAQDQARLDKIEARIDAIDAKPPFYSAETKAIAGAILTLKPDGKLDVEYGYVRPEDMPEQDPSEDTTTVKVSAQPAEYVIAGKPLNSRLVHDLTAYKTVAIRNAVALDPPAAFLTALHALCVKVFHPHGARSCAQISVNESFAISVPGLGDFAAAQAIETRHEQWQARIPQGPDELWQALIHMTDADRAELFAHCVSLSINAVKANFDNRQIERQHADQLAATLGLDLASAGWKTDAENYFSRINKAQILDAVREAKGEQTVQLIAHLKAADMAAEAARLLEDTAWVPPVLRITGSAAEPEAAPAALPAFLATDHSGESSAAAA